ncbi:MAG TPA: hypothetical protein VFL56_03590 [Solirubrobacterales bacterium]|nr:hypothetical protein [Solirubrobacterales bacterium]
MRAGLLAAAILGCAVLTAPACGGSGDDTGSIAARSVSTIAPGQSETAPAPAAVPTSDPGHGGAAGEASPEAAAEGPETGELSGADQQAVSRVVSVYVDALNRRDAAVVCSSFAAAIRLSELPRRHGGCVGSVGASLGSRPPGGGPAWRRTRIVEVSAVSVEGGSARATATVIHRFRDRRQPSIEEDVVYLDRIGRRWLLAKPSGTFYRAVGYADVPLRALTPP